MSTGTRIIDCCLCFSAVGSVFPIKMRILHRLSKIPEVHHFLPFMTYSSPSLTMLDSIFVASEEATAGSVIAKADRISPFNRGVNQRSLFSSVAYLSSTSILPVSGAEQLNTSDPKCTRPITSLIGAYSRLVRPAPLSDSGKNKFHRPAAFAFAFNSSSIGGQAQRSSASSIC